MAGLTSILVLLGPTAVGKTAYIGRIASQYKAVLYADTACLYKQLNIATAKPSLTEQALIPHYLIDLLDFNQEFNAKQYVTLADQTLAQLNSSSYHKDERPFILSGGSLFYLQSFLFGLLQAPPASPKNRAKVALMLQQQGQDALFALLQQVDPVSATRIDKANSYRLCRALEVYFDSGKPLSSFERPTVLRPQYQFQIIILERDRDILYQRINQRVEQMFADGLEREIEQLKDLGATASSPAMKAIGYAEWFNSSLTTLSEIKEAIRQNSRHYAKRQLTFLNKLRPYSTTIKL